MSNQPNHLLRDYGLTIGLAILVAFLIRFFLIEAYRIPSASMKPTLEAGDTIFASKLPFGMRWPGDLEPFRKGRMPAYGEVVVYTQVKTEGVRDAIKRVVGLPGDRIELRNGWVWINGKSLAEFAPKNQVCGKERVHGLSYPVCREPPIAEDLPAQTVPTHSVFVIGDSRGAESWSMIPVAWVKAKALWIWLSVDPDRGIRPSPFSRIRFERMLQEIH